MALVQLLCVILYTKYLYAIFSHSIKIDQEYIGLSRLYKSCYINK